MRGVVLSRGLVLVSAVLACAPPPAPQPTGTPPAKAEISEPKVAPEQPPIADDEDEVITFDAIVRVDAEPGSKRLQGVWLERGDGERWIVAYRAEPWLVPFADKAVSVTGGRYIPGGQAVKATHFRLDSLRVTDDKAAGLFESLGAEQTMTGEFAERTGTVGAKDEGERYPVFTSDAGNAFQLANHPADLAYGTKVKVRVREMEYSKFAAHRGGPLVWVIEIDGASTTKDAAKKAVARREPPYADLNADLDGDGTGEAIKIDHDGTVHAAPAKPAKFTWVHPTSDYWGGLDKDKRLSVLDLDAKSKAIVFWQFQDGDEDPGKRFHVWALEGGALHSLVEPPLDVAHAVKFSSKPGALELVEEGCTKDATIKPDGNRAKDGETTRTVTTLRWDPKRKTLVKSAKSKKSKSDCLLAG